MKKILVEELRIAFALVDESGLDVTGVDEPAINH